jgi:hypothetical protein
MSALAINRYIAICVGPGVNKMIFSYFIDCLAQLKNIFGGRMTLIWCVTTWLIGILIAIPTFHPCCRIVLRPEFYSWVYDDTPGGSVYSMIDLVTSVVVIMARTISHSLLSFRLASL